MSKEKVDNTNSTTWKMKNKSKEELSELEILFLDNIKLAYKIAAKYYSTPYWEKDEAIQIAELGLWTACLIWDPNKYKLSTLAYRIITHEFINHDTKMKRQPNILFNLEDNCVTDDLNLNDILVDEKSYIDEQIEQDEAVNDLSKKVIIILDEIAEELKINKSYVKTVYLVQIESHKNKEVKLKNIDFLPKPIVKKIINKLRIKLEEII